MVLRCIAQNCGKRLGMICCACIAWALAILLGLCSRALTLAFSSGRPSCCSPVILLAGQLSMFVCLTVESGSIRSACFCSDMIASRSVSTLKFRMCVEFCPPQAAAQQVLLCASCHLARS